MHRGPLGIEVGHATRIGARLFQMEVRVFVDAARGIAAVVRGYGGQGTGGDVADVVVDALGRAAGTDAADAVRRGLEAAARALPSIASAGPRSASVTALALDDRRLTVAHVGNGRAYLVRVGGVAQLTEDHVVDVGAALPRPVLRRALGLDGGTPDRTEHGVGPGDVVVAVNEAIARVVAAPILTELVGHATPQAVAEALVARAPGGESAAAVVVRVG